jgi:hypothetical protein
LQSVTVVRKCAVCGDVLTSINGYVLRLKSGESSFRKRCRKCEYHFQKDYNTRWAADHRDYFLRRIKLDYTKRGDILRALSRANRAKLKKEVLSHYSGNPPFCVNPYKIHDDLFTDIRCLTIDHVNGRGLAHKLREGISGGGMCAWLKRNNYPNGYQVLCMNCQRIKDVENGENLLRFDS